MSINPRPTAAVSSLSDKAAANSPPPAPDAVLEVALESLRVEHAHAEASRSRAAGLLIAVVHLLGI